MSREFVSFATGDVVHARDADDGRTLCGRECEGFGNDLDARIWARSPALRCVNCVAALERLVPDLVGTVVWVRRDLPKHGTHRVFCGRCVGQWTGVYDGETITRLKLRFRGGVEVIVRLDEALAYRDDRR